MDLEQQRLVSVLDETHQWPTLFAFKFIVPAQKGKELEDLMPEAHRVETRPSSGGKYTAYTFHCPVGSGREVISIYTRAQAVKGVMAL